MKLAGLALFATLRALVIVASFFAACALAHAQDWPTRPVKLLIPFGPGSTPDLVGRIIAERLQQKLGQPFVVEDKPGASGNLGTEAIARAEPDGYTLGISIAGPLAVNALLFSKLPYDPRKDFTYITLLVTQPSVLVVNAGLGVETVPQLVALLKRSPGKFNFGSIGNGSISHLAMAAIALASGTEVVHIPYTSSPQAMTALLRGEVQIACLPAAGVAPQLSSGDIRVLAVTTAARTALFPGIPTLKENGIDVEVDTWMGLVGPAHLTDAIAGRVANEVASVITAADVRDKLVTQLMEPIPSAPAAFRARIDADLARWAPVIRAANIRVN